MQLKGTALVVCAFAASLATTPAFADDPATAIDELKAGYALKQAGKCLEAIPHFQASFQADPKPKAVLNLADCEGRLGDLVAARGHATQGRDLARQQGDADLTRVAEEQLAAIDKRLPRLTVHLASGVPEGSVAVLDGTALTARSIDAALAVNPGVHHVIAAAAGHAQREFDVTLEEGGRTEIDVQPGASLVPDAPSLQPQVVSSGEPSGPPVRQVLTYGALGLGAAGTVVGVATGIAAGSKHATLEGECMGNDCPVSAQGDIDSFRSLRTWSTVGYVVGAVGLAGGAVLWFTAPRPSESAAAAGVWVGPRSAGVAGTF